jgi:hypothetical protein
MFLRSYLTFLTAGALVAAAQPAATQAPAPPAAAAQAAPAGDPAKGAALMAEARKALGGEDKVAAVKRLEIKAEMTQVTGNQTLDGDLTMQIESPDKYKRDEEISLPGGSITINRTLGLNGNEVWDVTEGGLPGGFGGRGGRGGGGRLGGILGAAGGNDANQGQLDPARQEALREQQRRTRQTDLTRYLVAFLGVTPEGVTWVGTAVTPKDEKADVLEFPTADGATTRLFLDETTHLPLMMTFNGPARAAGGQGRGNRGGGDAAAGGGFRGRRGGGDGGAAPQGDGTAAPGGPRGAAPQGGQRAGGFQPGQPTTVELYLGDYKTENGIKTPRHITREIAGEIQEELNIKSVKLNPNFKANTFVQPKQ